MQMLAPKVVRSKQIDLKPNGFRRSLSSNGFIGALIFFIYVDVEDQTTNVLYRREW